MKSKKQSNTSSKLSSTTSSFEVSGISDDDKIQINGDMYIGENINKIPNGTGVLSQKSGITYSGSWVDGKKDGYGTLIMPTGLVYNGYWKNDLKEGDFDVTSPYDGSYKEKWESGKLVFSSLKNKK